MSELDDDEKFPTEYKHKDGSTAYVFSSTVAKTVERHFRWMKESGIDGVFVQRFDDYLHNQRDLNYRRACAVLHHVREAANRNGRAYAVMYDMHFDRGGVDVVKADWARLLAEMRITRDPAYIHHRGRPVISLWGYGFEERGFDAAAVESLFAYLQSAEGGGCTIMIGTPNDWVRWTGDRMRLLTKYATIISPWNVGRYHDEQSAKDFFAADWPADLAFCREHDKDYYAVAFPGFSWHNLAAWPHAAWIKFPRRNKENSSGARSKRSSATAWTCPTSRCSTKSMKEPRSSNARTIRRRTAFARMKGYRAISAV